MRIRTSAPEAYDYAHTRTVSQEGRDRVVEVGDDSMDPERREYLARYQQGRYQSGMYYAHLEPVESPEPLREEGARVMYAKGFLRSTGQYTGPVAPCHYGPFARGTSLGPAIAVGLPEHLTVRWDDGYVQHVHQGNVVLVGTRED